MTETFEIIPASAKAFWVIGIVSLILVGILVLFGFMSHSSRNARFVISSEGLQLRGDMYGRTIAARDLIVEEAEHVNLRQKGPYSPKWRTFGTGLPGYLAGWFKLQNGDKALLYVTDTSSVVRIPTRNGYQVLLSVEDPHRFLEALGRMGG
jgi:hypothetical protein